MRLSVCTRLIALAATVVAAASGVPATAAAGETEPVTVPDRATRDALYAWLDDVGYPDGVGRRAVWLHTWGDPELAFVTAEDGASLTVFALYGRSVTVTPGAEQAGGAPPPRVTEADLDSATELRLHDRERDGGDDERLFWGNPYELSGRVRFVLLARHAWRSGETDREERLLAAAAATPGVLEWAHDRSGKALDDLVRRDVELFERTRTWEDFAALDDLDARRDVLLRYARLFPGSEFAATAAEQAETLAEMREAAVQVPGDAALAELHGDALARGLVLRLREQTAWAEAMGGATTHMNGRGDSPLDRLIAMGEDALPALLGAMQDPTLSRVVSHGRVGVHPLVHTVGNLARDGVQAITGQWFQNAKDARAWLARREKDGEAALLAAQVFQGTWIDVGAARRLVSLDPAVAARTLGELLEREMTDRLRMQLIRELGVAEHPGVVPLLRAECAADRAFPVRQAAESVLAGRAPGAARDVALVLWHTDSGLVPLSYPARAADADRYWDRESAWGLLIPQLVALAAWDEIEAELPAKTLHTRATMLRTLALSAPDPLAGGAVSRMLLDGLRDGTDAPYGLGASGLGNCPDTRVCDLVGAELAARHAAWQPFPALSVREDRDAVLGEMRNALRRSLGEETRAEPGRRASSDASDEDVAELAAAFATDDVAALDAAEDAVVAGAGLPALAALHRALDALPAEAPGRSAFERALGRLATTVGRVIVRDGADEEAGRALRAFEGRPLDVDGLVARLRELLAGGHALTLLVHRPADGTGCTIAVEAARPSQRDRLEIYGSFSQSSSRSLDDGAWRMIAGELSEGRRRRAASGWAVRIGLR